MSGYLTGLSSPSVTERTTIRSSSPSSNSPGRRGYTMFSMMTRSSESRSKPSRHLRIHELSRWQSPPKSDVSIL